MVCVVSEYYSDKVRPDSDLVLPAFGELVVVRCTANEHWYRAVVTGRDLDHNIKVHSVFKLSRYIWNLFLISFSCDQSVSLLCVIFTSEGEYLFLFIGKLLGGGLPYLTT